MDIPVYSTPEILKELMDSYKPCFNDVRQFKHFEELVSAFQISDKRSIAHLNSTVINHTNQSSMNRFLSSGIDMNLMFSKTIELILNPSKPEVIISTGVNSPCSIGVWSIVIKL